MGYYVSPRDSLAMALFMYEGGRTGTPSVRCIRNNNPGNLRPYLNSQAVDEDNYRTFPSFAEGWLALQNDIQAKLKLHLKPTDTLLSFLNLYAPAGDNNNPNLYAKFVADWMSVQLAKTILPSTQLKDIFQ